MKAAFFGCCPTLLYITGHCIKLLFAYGALKSKPDISIYEPVLNVSIGFYFIVFILYPALPKEPRLEQLA